jgi:hypothetical protein
MRLLSRDTASGEPNASTRRVERKNVATANVAMIPAIR